MRQLAVLGNWLAERRGEDPEPLFSTSTGRPLTRDALERLLSKHAAHAAERCPSLRTKKITPHVLRHTAAMRLLHAGIDTSVIALWLGHEQIQTTPDISTSRPRNQGKSTLPNHTPQRQARPLPATRHTPRLPRGTMIMRPPQPRSPPKNSIHKHQVRIIQSPHNTTA
jgi:integrase